MNEEGWRSRRCECRRDFLADVAAFADAGDDDAALGGCETPHGLVERPG